ncbi:hypothetical protein [Acanthopleuribacter pedis]|uniref:Uncharacterized protein n=1 Tax=Acanthopleuribacter pedis TaxID=442870 RepID=A0A8J7QDU3_9BACT|nr:hypothetical protein [Acanthopleuribacter pedis]MBO1317243.1 hypothetical protein [Acanthopleuribacter pedis]MBO1318550.1 hypothetical protein [Acanthopleuribacter pedis]
MNQAMLGDRSALPSSAFSYLGYAMALRENKLWEGLNMAQLGVENAFYDADNFFNLARIYLLRDNRRGAHQAIVEGLKVSPDHRGLLALQGKIGVRARPVIPFLNRDHLFNIYLGKVRHSLKNARSQQKKQKSSKAGKKVSKKQDVPNLFDL